MTAGIGGPTVNTGGNSIGASSNTNAAGSGTNSTSGLPSNNPGTNNPHESIKPGDERIVYTHGFATPEERVIRQDIINRGVRPGVSYQPYVSSLVNALVKAKAAGNGDPTTPRTISNEDAACLNLLVRHMHGNSYRPHVHQDNTDRVIKYLKTFE